MIMKKINISELLKDCPKGMELDCTIWDNVTFERVANNGIWINHLNDKNHKYEIYLDNEGCLPVPTLTKTKCVIFPKEKTTWEGFVPPCKFKNGDIMAVENDFGIHIFIYNHTTDKYDSYGYYAILTSIGNFKINSFCSGNTYRLATKEEKEKLFDAIKAHGYKWNEETKTLEKLFELKFHNGDWVTNGDYTWKVISVDIFDYTLQNQLGEYVEDTIDYVNKEFHLWTIKDAKDGDVLFHSDSASNGIFIFKEILQLGTIQKVICYCDYDSEDGFCLGENHTCCWTDSKILHPATEEQRNILFRKMKEAGYIWNPETKTLEKLVEPKFKVGDRIVHKVNKEYPFTITEITDVCYKGGYRYCVLIEQQDNFELVPNKFDITNLIPFESKVLVRDNGYDVWRCAFWSYIRQKADIKYDTTRGVYRQCIPYEGNEHLLGTTNDCSDFYKTWSD